MTVRVACPGRRNFGLLTCSANLSDFILLFFVSMLHKRVLSNRTGYYVVSGGISHERGRVAT